MMLEYRVTARRIDGHGWLAQTKGLMALAIGIAVHRDGCMADHTKMAHHHKATQDEAAETVSLALQVGGGPAAVYGADALSAYDDFAEGNA